MLEPLGCNLWFANGGIVSFAGFDYPTRMAVVVYDLPMGRQTTKDRGSQLMLGEPQQLMLQDGGSTRSGDPEIP